MLDLNENYVKVTEENLNWFLDITKTELGTTAKKKYYPNKQRDYYYYSNIKKDGKTFKVGYIEYIDSVSNVPCAYYVNKNFMPYARQILNK